MKQDTYKRDVSRLDRNVEDEFFGKWFPRIGALAIVLGAGFGFKYAIDQGWVGPRLRVTLGLLLSLVLIGIGDWARKREWSAYAHAITGGGLGLMYLTLWAAVGMYGLVPASVGFICLMGVSALGCVLAIRHESQTLALLSVIGGFINPFVTGASAEMPQGLYLYILSVDIAVVFLGFIRPWALLEKVAFVASWIVLELGGGSTLVSLSAATALFVMFGAIPYVRLVMNKDQGPADIAMIPINALLYYFAIFTQAGGRFENVRGPLTLGLAAFFLLGFLAVRDREDDDGLVGSLSAVISVIFLTLWVPVELGVELMALGWAIEALALLGAAIAVRDVRVGYGGWIVLAMSANTQLFFIAKSSSAALDDNYGRFVLITLVAAIYVGSYLASRYQASEVTDLCLTAANLLTLFWLSLEVNAFVYQSDGSGAQDLHFGLSGVWGLYASILLGVGIYFRARQARMLSLVLFGVTLGKMALHDLWLLDTLQRLIGFVGIGVLLLTCSLMYHRFREWVLGAGT